MFLKMYINLIIIKKIETFYFKIRISYSVVIIISFI